MAESADPKPTESAPQPVNADATALEPGDIVLDEEQDEGSTAVVVNATDTAASKRFVPALQKTVAAVNDEYPATDPVIEILYTDDARAQFGKSWIPEDVLTAYENDALSGRLYACPESRLTS